MRKHLPSAAVSECRKFICRKKLRRGISTFERRISTAKMHQRVLNVGSDYVVICHSRAQHVYASSISHVTTRNLESAPLTHCYGNPVELRHVTVHSPSADQLRSEKNSSVLQGRLAQRLHSFQFGQVIYRKTPYLNQSDAVLCREDYDSGKSQVC